MALLEYCWRPRPVLQFLTVRGFRPPSPRTSRSRPAKNISSPILPPRIIPARSPPPRASSTGPPSPKVPQNPSTSSETTQNEVPAQTAAPSAQQPSISKLLSQTDSSNNSLLAPVHVPEDPRAILKSNHPSTSLLEQSGIVVQRQIEMMNVFLGFEQANRYVIMDPQGNHIGYMAEHDGGIAKAMGRQWFRTHRNFMVHVFGRDGQEVLRFHRPFSWINTNIRVYDPVELASGLTTSSSTDLVKSNAVADAVMNQQISSLKLEEMKVIGEAHSQWAPLRRKYNLFLAHQLLENQEIASEAVPQDLSARQQGQVKNEDHFSQFAYIDEPFLSWDFSLKDADNKLIGSVNRNWGGLGREFFTDTGTYVLRMDAVGLEAEADNRHIVSQTNQGERAYAETLGGSNNQYGMTLDQRAVMLATAVTVDFDYFSRHSHAGGIMPMPLMMGGGGAAEGGAAGGAAGAGTAGAEGAIGETVAGGAIGTAGRAAGAAGVGEGAVAGAGTMAGYEAMQRGMGRDGQSGNDPSSQDPPYPGAGASEAAGQDSGFGNQYDPQSPQYGQGNDYYPPQQGVEPGQQGQEDVWGSGNTDPWAEGNTGGDGGGGGEEGGIVSKLWDIFGGDD